MTCAYFAGRGRFLVEHAVDEAIGKCVLLARHVANIDFSEAAQQAPRARVSGCRPACLTRYSPRSCLTTSSESSRTASRRMPRASGRLEPEHERRPFGDVIGRDARDRRRPLR